MRRRRGQTSTRGLTPGLVVPEGGAAGWFPATSLVHGTDRPGHDDLGLLLDAAKQRWSASPHAAAALTWRSYTYWLSLPVVIGWALARRVVLVDPADVLVRLEGEQQLLSIGLRRVRLAVLPDDPLTSTGAPGVDLAVVDSEPELLATLRRTLRADHLDPMLARLQQRTRLGGRVLLGSLASAIAYGVIRSVDAPWSTQLELADSLLSTLELDNLVDVEPTSTGLAVQRRTCCLAFTLPEPKICASCCLR